MNDNTATILLVEDDKNLGFLLSTQLEDEGFTVILKKDGEEGFNALKELHYDLCILDVMLPKMDGYELSEKLLELKNNIPFIFLTARALKSDRINGYKAGADDYIVKPFDTDELIYKIRAILKRSGKTEVEQTELIAGKCKLIKTDRTLFTPKGEFHLSNKESLLIALFFNTPNNTIPKSTLLKHVWGRDDYFTAKSMEVYLTKVRKYLKTDKSIELQNIHGYGYKLSVNT